MRAPPRSNSEWKEWGRRDPLFGVANLPGRNIGGERPWTPDDFYELGAESWRDFSPHWQRYGFKPGSFVEIGCGAGRMTKQLAATFESGHALDVSDDQIAIASENVPKNVTWHVTQGAEIPLKDNSVDAAFSCHVFQHLPSVDDGYAYFREIARVLTPGGSLMVHVPLHVWPDHGSAKFAKLFAWAFRNITLPYVDLNTGLKRAKMRFGGQPPMHGISYDANELYSVLAGLPLTRITYEIFTSTGALHPFVFATKAAAPQSMLPT